MISLLSSSTFSHPKESTRKNEDSILPPQLVGDGYLMAIADGVGSYAGADQASQAAIGVISRISSQEWRQGISTEDIFNEVKQRVSGLSTKDQSLSDAATTLTFCYVDCWGVRIGHVGDCRAYIRKGGTLVQLTADHTQHQRLIDEGLYKPNELKRMGGKNTLFAALSKKVNLHYQEIVLPYESVELEESRFEILLMSDGAHQAWDLRPRFALGTLLEPSRFASSLSRRINLFSPVDDYSLIAAKFQVCKP